MARLPEPSEDRAPLPLPAMAASAARFCMFIALMSAKRNVRFSNKEESKKTRTGNDATLTTGCHLPSELKMPGLLKLARAARLSPDAGFISPTPDAGLELPFNARPACV